MGLRRLCFLLSVTCALVVSGCGDNIHPGVPGDGKGSDSMGMGSDAGSNMGSDAGSGSDAAVCGSPDIMCGSACVDPNTDNTHCGGCGTDCTLGGTSSQVCITGICCDPGQIDSMGHCCNSGDHYDNGICCSGTDVNVGGTPPICCPSGDINSSGHCCGSGQHYDNGICCDGTKVNVGGICCIDNTYLNCGGTCVPAGGNDMNCGGCPGMGGVDCTLTSQFCQGGICCDAGKVNVNGICCNSGEFNVNGICCGSSTDLNCGGMCVDPNTDNSSCGGCVGSGGTACGGSQTCQTGICCDNPKINIGGICCLSGQHNSSGICCDAGLDNVGGICCNTATQVNGGGSPPICCATATPTNCGGTCVNTNTNNADCGGCGKVCSSNNCLSGNCCAAGSELCSGSCSDPLSDPNNCGACGTKCTGTNNTCTTGALDGLGHCCPSGQTFQTTVCCPSGQHEDGGICCGSGLSNCGGTCVNLNTDPNNCTGCGLKCPSLAFCDPAGGTGTPKCSSSCPVGTTACPVVNPTSCVDLTGDVNNCGSCGNMCATGQSCTSSTCQCPAGDTLCASGCSNTNTDPNNCGGCAGSGGAVCGTGQQCEKSTTAPTNPICCNVGQVNCAGTCSNLNDTNNCGTCGNSCGSGSTCQNGSCQCPSGTITCGGNCITPTVDPLNCGSCGNICNTGPNAGKQYCVSNSCVAKCPTGLCGTGNGANATCVNPLDDNKHCGAGINADGTCGTGTDCTSSGKVCSNGSCVTGITTLPPPAKCVGGGPPIIVPGGSTGSECAGNLADTSFLYGLCTCTDIGPLSRQLTTDGFDSSIGAYVGPAFAGTACTTAADCGLSCTLSHTACAADANCANLGKRCSATTTTTCSVNTDCPNGETCITNTCSRTEIQCVAGTCAAGGVATDGTESDTADTDVGGSFVTWSTSGIATKGNVNVLQGVFDRGPYNYAKTTTVYGNSQVVGAFSKSGSGTAIFGVSPAYPITVHTATCAGLPASLTIYNTCVTPTGTINQPCCSTGYQIDVKGIVHHFSDPANNDDAAIGVSPSLFDNPSGTIRLDLACGNYYFHSFNGSGATITIYVHGHVGLFISGAIKISQTVIFDLDSTATLDIFVGNVLSVSQDTHLGSPAFPRQTRMYFGSGACTSSTCTTNEDCCGGVCNTGVCGGGITSNLTDSVSLSNSGHFNGLMWAGYGTFSHSNPLEMYGAIFANHFDASGETTIHYDNGIVSAPNECPPPPVGGICDSYRDCNNNPCIGGNCANCTDSSQCPTGLNCVGGNCTF